MTPSPPPLVPREQRKNFQAWISEEAFEAITTWCRAAGVTRTAYLEAMGEWCAAHPFLGPAQASSAQGSDFIRRARQITAESRGRESR